MAVKILWLTGRAGAEAVQAANEMLDLRTGPPDLRKLLVVDDTALLAGHAAVFDRLFSARRVDNLLCLAVGPRPGSDSVLRLPHGLAGAQESGVLWVGDPDGIGWRATVAATVVGHPRGSASGLDRLIELLLVQDVFDRVYETFVLSVPDRVASPGLRLAGADDEAATFAAALALAIRRITEPGTGDDGPFSALLQSHARTLLAEDGRLASYRAEVATATAAAGAKLTRAGGLFRRGAARVDEPIRAAGAALAQLRELVDQLLRAANTTDGLTGNQRDMLRDAGLQLPAAPGSRSSAVADGEEPTRPPAYMTIADALGGDDTLPLIMRRLTATAKEFRRYGSAAYLQEVDERCPPSLLASLASVDAPSAATRRADPAAVRRELGLDAADHAADALITLVVTVAAREWSPPLATRDELDRARIAIEGIRKALTEYAAATAPIRAARLTRLSESLRPVLRNLVLQVLADEYAAPGTAGQDSLEAAQRRTGHLLADWTQLVQAGGVSARPKFATSRVDEVSYSVESDVAAIREALLAEPREQMWQLCGQADVTALDVAATPLTIRFAPRLNKDALASLPQWREMVWTSSGSQAGVLRLVPLRREVISGNSAESRLGDEESQPDDAAVPEPW